MTSCLVVITCVVKLYYNPEINNFYLIQTKKPNVDALIGYKSTFKDSTNIFLVAKKKKYWRRVIATLLFVACPS